MKVRVVDHRGARSGIATHGRGGGRAGAVDIDADRCRSIDKQVEVLDVGIGRWCQQALLQQQQILEVDDTVRCAGRVEVTVGYSSSLG